MIAQYSVWKSRILDHWSAQWNWIPDDFDVYVMDGFLRRHVLLTYRQGSEDLVSGSRRKPKTIVPMGKLHAEQCRQVNKWRVCDLCTSQMFTAWFCGCTEMVREWRIFWIIEFYHNVEELKRHTSVCVTWREYRYFSCHLCFASLL